MSEIWKQSSLEPQYEVSSEGNIRKVLNDGTYKPVRQHLHPDGYMMCACGKQTWVHRLIATEFCYNDDPEHKVIVDHINNIKRDNRAKNLEWVTQKENLRRARLQGHIPTRTMIRCAETGEIFTSFQDCSLKTGIRYESLRGSVNQHTTTHGYHFERYLESTDGKQHP